MNDQDGVVLSCFTDGMKARDWSHWDDELERLLNSPAIIRLPGRRARQGSCAEGEYRRKDSTVSQPVLFVVCDYLIDGVVMSGTAHHGAWK